MFFVLKFELILIIAQIMCLRRAPEKYIAGAALDRAGLGVLRETEKQRAFQCLPAVGMK
jgi:hypothetical protein